MKQSFTFIAIVLFFSASAQITWTTGNNIAANTYSNLHPRMALDAAGNPLVIWGRMSDQSVFFTRWTGSMFSTPVKLNGTLTIASATWMGPDIASHGDTVYVVMKQTPEADSASHIYSVHSYDGGMTFSSPLQVDNIGDSISRFPAVATDAIGNPVVAFMKFNSTFNDSRWVVTKSTDFGNTFSNDIKASGWGSPAICDCCPGALVTSDSTCVMMFRNNNANVRDAWAGISSDNATSFTNGFALENNNWMLMSCPSSGPDGVIIGDTLFSVFMNGASGNYRTYLSRASLSNGIMTSVNNLTGNVTGLSQQNFPRIARSGNAMAIVWRQTVSGAAQLPILFTNDIAAGFPSAYDTVDLNDITNSDIAMNNVNIFVVWEDDNSGTVKYRFGTYVPLVSGASDLAVENNISIYPNPADDLININSPANKIMSVSVFNSLGAEIYSIRVLANHKLETSGFDKGLYFLRIKIDGKFYSQKFIKQ